jgi:hypothetical protein
MLRVLTTSSSADAGVLVIDDYPANLLAFRAALEPLGLRIVTASTGAEGVACANRDDFAVILLDLRMPTMDGLATAAVLKRSERARRTPIIFLTASDDGTAVARAKAYTTGAVDFLVKPVDPEILRSKVSVFAELWRLRAQEARQAAEQSSLRELSMLSDAMPALVWKTDKSGDVTLYNRRWKEYAALPARPTRKDWLELIHPDDRPRWVEAWDAALQGLTSLDIECRVRRADGVYRWHLARAVPQQDERGQIDAWIGSAVDIQAQKAAVEAESRAKAAAEEASRLRDEFLTTISHELRTPLSAVVGWSELLEEGLRNDPDQLDHGLQVITRNAKALTKLVEDVLDVSRMMRGQLRIEPRLLDLETIARDAVDTVSAAATSKRVRVEFEGCREECKLVADPARLQQIIWNLLSNAVKFTPAGGAVELHIGIADGSALIEVRDTGAGIDPKFLPHVFERFRQADSSSTRSYGGLGLGLAIVRELAELHGGTVMASSPGVGQGATFSVRLPVQPFESIAPHREPQPFLRRDEASTPAERDLAQLRILVVEDHADTRELIERALVEAGADVRAVAGARRALEIAKEGKIDVVVSDLAMPDCNGFWLAEHLKADRPSLPAIALSAFSRPADIARARESGFVDYLRKPTTRADLVRAVMGARARAPAAN